MVKSELELLSNAKSLFNENKYQEALDLILENEDLIEKKYYEIARIKIECLINLKNYIDACSLIKEELNVPYVPMDFEDFLKEKYKYVSYILKGNQARKFSVESLDNIDKLDNNELLNILDQLKDFNLNPYVDKFQNIFDNVKIQGLTKSLLIACLSDNKINHRFHIYKNQTLVMFNPVDVFDIRDGENYLYIAYELRKLNDIENNILDLLNRLVVMYLLDVYPLVISEKECDMVIAVCLKLVSEMMSRNIKIAKYEEILANNVENVKKIVEKMNILLETI